MIYRKLIFVSIFIGAALCSPQQNTTTPPADSKSNEIQDDKTEVTSNGTTIKDKIQLTVYYETYCPFSVEFFIEQLKPAVIKLSTHLDMQLIPYGHAETDDEVDEFGRYSFTCQHGPIECRGNMMQACVIDVLGNMTQAALYNTCLMVSLLNYTDMAELTPCSEPENVTKENIAEIYHCFSGTRGPTLLKSYGELTQANDVKGVPHLLLDGSTERKEDARHNLVATICDMLNPKPEACTST